MARASTSSKNFEHVFTAKTRRIPRTSDLCRRETLRRMHQSRNLATDDPEPEQLVLTLLSTAPLEPKHPAFIGEPVADPVVCAGVDEHKYATL